MVDSHDIHAFSDRLSQEDGIWTIEAEYVLSAQIWQQLLNADLPDPTPNQLRLYLQIRDAAHRAKARDEEWLTPVPVPRDNPECMICREHLGQPSEDGQPAEDAVQLPCLHIYGRTCLQEWIRPWGPGPAPLVVCTLCREGFGLLSPRELRVGIDLPAQEEVPALPGQEEEVVPDSPAQRGVAMKRRANVVGRSPSNENKANCRTV
jgi:hypothetical protein